MQDTVWTCKDGRQILVSDMSNNHLCNCINMIHRSNGWRQQYLPRLELEITIRHIKSQED